jgi:hypothetical protein
LGSSSLGGSRWSGRTAALGVGSSSSTASFGFAARPLLQRRAGLGMLLMRSS